MWTWNRFMVVSFRLWVVGWKLLGGDQHWQAAVAPSVRQAAPWQQFSVR